MSATTSRLVVAAAAVLAVSAPAVAGAQAAGPQAGRNASPALDPDPDPDEVARRERDRDRATARGRIELRTAFQYSLSNSARFAEDLPRVLGSASVGYFPFDDYLVAAGWTLGLSGDDGTSYEGYAQVARHFRAPIARLFAAFRAGYYKTEVTGSDFVFVDHGLRVGIDAGLRIAPPLGRDASVFVEPTLFASLQLSQSIHDERNDSAAAWTGALLAGLAVPLTF